MNNFIFIGMPGSGKSTIAKLFAKEFNLNFYDTDKLIENKFGNIPLQEVLDNLGENKFKQEEENIICSLNLSSSVIATGGSVVYSEKSMAHLKRIGTIIYLDVSCSLLLTRIKNPTSRGIVLSPGESFSDLYMRRTPLYNKYADIVLMSGKESPKKTLMALNHILKNKNLLP